MTKTEKNETGQNITMIQHNVMYFKVITLIASEVGVSGNSSII